MAGNLVQEIEGAQRAQIYRQTIAFLKVYVATHFRDEEAYFASIGYTEEEKHKQQHRELAKEVEKYAVQLEKTDYDLQTAKKLAGMLSAWLVYHVVKEDMKYVGKGQEQTKQEKASFIEYFADSTVQVLEAMVGLKSEEVKRRTIDGGVEQEAVFIEIGLIGSITGRVVFGFPKEFSICLVEAMLAVAPEELDELVCSALSEISNIAAGNGTIAIAQGGTDCNICTPKILENGLADSSAYEKVQLETKMGTMTVSVYVD